MSATDHVARVGKRGAVVLPADLRRRYGIQDGALVVAEAHEHGILIRPAVLRPDDSTERERLMDETLAGYAALRADAAEWQSWTDEVKAWDATLADGLEPEPPEPAEEATGGDG